jgi:hypothetical protein
MNERQAFARQYRAKAFSFKKINIFTEKVSNIQIK